MQPYTAINLGRHNYFIFPAHIPTDKTSPYNHVENKRHHNTHWLKVIKQWFA